MGRAFRSAANIVAEYKLTKETLARFHTAIIEAWARGEYDATIEVRADDLHALTFALAELEFRDEYADTCKRCKDPIGPDEEDVSMFARAGICFHCYRQIAPALRRLRASQEKG